MNTSFKNLVAAVALSAVLVPLVALAAPIVISNTGVDSGGVGAGSLDVGDLELHYTSTPSTPPAVVTHPAYFPNNSLSQWIWGPTSGFETVTFTTTFDLSGLDHTSALLVGAWGTDNQGLDIILNGFSTGITLPTGPTSFNALTPFAISSNFVPGVNTLQFVVQNNGGPGAFRAELTGTANPLEENVVPAPGTLALAGLALLGVGVLGRRKRG